MAAPTAEQIAAAAVAALSMRTAGGERQSRVGTDMIALWQYAAGATANASSASPIRMQRIRFGGTVVSEESE